MSTRGLSGQLSRIIEQAIKEHKLQKFAQYWELYENTTDIESINAYFARTEVQDDDFDYVGGGYCNVAIIAEGLVIDIEGDDSDNTGSLTFHTLDSFSSIELHAGALRGLDSSRGALLVVLANRAGEDDIGLHWIAKTEQDKERLLSFAQVLVREISAG